MSNEHKNNDKENSNNRYISWFSCGGASAVATWLILKENPKTEVVYIDTGGEHPDNKRFIADMEQKYGKKITVLKNEKYEDHFDVIEKTRYINGPAGARCTGELKKEVRFKFELPTDIQIFGYTVDEQDRAERFNEAFPEVNTKFILIEEGLTKENCMGILSGWGIELPAMYKMGYSNNNCIGCVKGGKGYWNKIRRDYPDHFKRMMDIENNLKRSCINGTFLKDLDPKAGRYENIKISCDFLCASYDK